MRPVLVEGAFNALLPVELDDELVLLFEVFACDAVHHRFESLVDQGIVIESPIIADVVSQNSGIIEDRVLLGLHLVNQQDTSC